jgi:UTP--glucose-1-phosphate uridylyltransferase/phosphoglucomutase
MSEAYAAKMRAEGLSEAAVAAFLHGYGELVSGNSGMIEEKDIAGVASLPDLDTIRKTVKADHSLLQVLLTHCAALK